MNAFSPLPLLQIGLIFFVAGIVKGATGMGLPTVAMGLLGTMLPPAGAAALLIVPAFVTNVWQLLSGPSFRKLLSRLSLMLLGLVAGTVAGASLMSQGGAPWTVAGLGAALVLYAIVGLMAWQPSVPARLERRASPVVGVVTGLITGATGVFVIPAVPYMAALGLQKDELIQALGLSFTVSTVALAIGLAWGGALHLGEMSLSLAALVPASLGMGCGQWLRMRVSLPTFRRWFYICLLLLGGELLAQRLF